MATKNHENTLFKVITSCRGYITKRRDYRYKTSGLPLQNVGITVTKRRGYVTKRRGYVTKRRGYASSSNVPTLGFGCRKQAIKQEKNMYKTS